MSAWEGSAWQQAMEEQREREARTYKLATERSPEILMNALRQKPEKYSALFPSAARFNLEQTARQCGYSIRLSVADDGNSRWLNAVCAPLAEPLCRWCGKSYNEHGEPYAGRPTPRTPCLLLRSKFADAATVTTEEKVRALDCRPYDPMTPSELDEAARIVGDDPLSPANLESVARGAGEKP